MCVCVCVCVRVCSSEKAGWLACWDLGDNGKRDKMRTYIFWAEAKRFYQFSGFQLQMFLKV